MRPPAAGKAGKATSDRSAGPVPYARRPDILALADQVDKLGDLPAPGRVRTVQILLDIIERQRDAMETMRSSFEFAIRSQPPPATRQALADMVRHLRENPP